MRSTSMGTSPCSTDPGVAMRNTRWALAGSNPFACRSPCSSMASA